MMQNLQGQEDLKPGRAGAVGCELTISKAAALSSSNDEGSIWTNAKYAYSDLWYRYRHRHRYRHPRPQLMAPLGSQSWESGVGSVGNVGEEKMGIFAVVV
jgi:hypothetical protein